MVLTIIGSSSLLSSHLLSLLFSDRSPLETQPEEIRLWSRESVEGPKPESLGASRLFYFEGDDQLEAAVQGAETVINCHSCTDWSIVPDEKRLRKENVEVPRRILSAISPTANLIQMSSALVQAGSRWPNIGGKEQRASDYEGSWPFKPYCRSLMDGESLVLTREGPTLVVRVPLLYGEGDERGPVMDAIKLSALCSSTLPLIGDRGGCMQFSYAGNIAAGVLRATKHCLQREEACKDPHARIAIVTDETAVNNTYHTVMPLIQNGKIALSSFPIPFFLLYLPYLLFSLLVGALSRVVEMPDGVRKLPSPSLFLFFFHHWTCFSSFKARLFLDHRDVYTKEEAQSRSSAYYRKINPEDIAQYSWQG